MIIRQALDHDAPAIHQLLVELGYPLGESLTRQKIEAFEHGCYRILVGEEEGVVLGFISLHWFDMFHTEKPMGRISAFCVRDGSRGQGVGQQLLTAAERVLQEEGCSSVEVTAHIKRTDTHRFYARNGYAEDSRRFKKKIGT